MHIRFEEKNLSVGFRIEMIEFTTEKTHWNFYGGLSDLRFTRQPNKYINKELNIVHLAIYTDEQIFVAETPNKLTNPYIAARKSVQLGRSGFLESSPKRAMSRGVQPYQDELSSYNPVHASGALRDKMNAVFSEPYEFESKKNVPGKETAMRENYLLEPMFVNVAINLNTCYVPQYEQQPFKYSVGVLVSNVVTNLSPKVITKLFDATEYAQMNSYREQLKKFRPRFRIKAFLTQRNYNGGLSTSEQRKLRACIRDSFRMALWFVRLRKAAKGVYHSELVRVEQMVGPCRRVPHPVTAVKSAELPIVDPTPNLTPADSDNELEQEWKHEKDELIESIKKEAEMNTKSAKAKADYFDGMQFLFKLDSFQVKISSL